MTDGTREAPAAGARSSLDEATASVPGLRTLAGLVVAVIVLAVVYFVIR